MPPNVQIVGLRAIAQPLSNAGSSQTTQKPWAVAYRFQELWDCHIGDISVCGHLHRRLVVEDHHRRAECVGVKRNRTGQRAAASTPGVRVDLFPMRFIVYLLDFECHENRFI